ncbi:MAG: methylglutaconyl-CoA hydratase [Flavobacteriales bacterium]|jgi:methylglutaconyl-CoA hydratase
MVNYHVADRIGYITLNRPEKRNALNDEMVTALKNAFKQAENDESCKVIILHANGDVFCAGADLAYLKKLQENNFEENLTDSKHLMSLFKLIHDLPKVVIAQVEGHAIAGGAGLATVCDIVFSVPEAKFGYTEVRIGFIPAIVSIFLARKVGEAHTKDLLLSGRLVHALEAKEMRMINFVYEAKEIQREVLQYAKHICSDASGTSLALTKNLIGNAFNLQLQEFLIVAAEMNAEARGSDDCQRGISAFLNKEKIMW